jgi:SAM-dependent methyltransferase
MNRCPCCGATEFIEHQILWDELIKEWGISKQESEYINRQQGLCCTSCACNLRSMTLAHAIMQAYEFKGDFAKFVKKYKSKLKSLEINAAGQLTPFLQKLKDHEYVEYPEMDMQAIERPDDTYDLIIHSDTLEHVPDPVQGLKEVRRILKPGGYMCYTIPIIVGRMTKKRDGKKPSHHGSLKNKEYLVQTEYGSDMWTQAFEAGFTDVRLLSISYPDSVAIVAKKA